MSHYTVYTCDACKGSIESDGIGFFRVTPPHWSRTMLGKGDGSGFGDIDL